MKFRAFSVGTAVLLMVVGIALAIKATATLPNNSSENNYRISGPYSHGNLSIFLIHGKDTIKGKNFLTLQEALEQKVVIVHETKDVNELAIENVSRTQEVYVQAGEIVKGGQQDRVLGVDLIVPARSGRMPIAAFCVEQGRWRQRDGEAAVTFGSSNESIATRDLKLAANKSKSQSEVWAKVAEAQEKLSDNVGGSVNSTVSSSSLQLSLEDKKLKRMTEGYIQKLTRIIDGKSDVIGYAFAINGQINSADVYGSNTLFRKLWPKLLKASTVEAIAELNKAQGAQPVKGDAVEAFIAQAEDGKISENAVTARTKVITRDSEKRLMLETRDETQGAAVLHRSYVNKQ